MNAPAVARIRSVPLIWTIAALAGGCVVAPFGADNPPQVTCSSANMRAVREALTDEWQRRGWTVWNVAESRLVFEPETEKAAIDLMGFRYNAKVKTRLTFALEAWGSRVHVTGRIDYLENPDTESERKTDMTSGLPGREVQGALDAMKRIVEANSPAK